MKYNDKIVFKSIDLYIPNNSIVSIVGRNGIGKSTFVYCLSKRCSEYSGNIYINGKNLKLYSIKELSQTLSILYSNCNLYNNLKVKDFLVMGFTNEMNALDKPSEKNYSEAYRILNLFNKQYVYNKPIYSLSSGELQIIKFARVLLQNTPIMVFDEPMENLDIETQLLILKLLDNLHKEGHTILVITHNLRHMLELKGKLLLLSDNEYVYCNSDDIINDDIMKSYTPVNTSYLQDKNDMVITFFDQKKIYI